MLDEKRMNRVLEKLDTDQMLITDPFAIYYLTGRWIFAGERFLVLLIKKGKKPILYLNELFRFDEDLGVTKKMITDTDSVAELLKYDVDPNEALGVDKTLAARFLLPMIDGAIA